MTPGHHGIPRRIAAATLAVALAAEAKVAFAAEPSTPPPQVIDAFARGEAAYARGDYAEAAKLWHAASKQLPPEHARARARLVLDVATALEREFDANGKRKSLDGARGFVAWYGEQIDAAYTDPAERARERARARDRLARIDLKIASPAEPPPPRYEETDPIDPTGEATAERLRRKHRRMIGGGVVLTLVGVGGLGMIAGGGLTDRKWLLYTGVGTALVFGVVGPVMIGFGVRRKRRALSAALDTTPRLGLTAGRGGAGFSLSGRF